MLIKSTKLLTERESSFMRVYVQEERGEDLLKYPQSTIQPQRGGINNEALDTNKDLERKKGEREGRERKGGERAWGLGQ